MFSFSTKYICLRRKLDLSSLLKISLVRLTQPTNTTKITVHIENQSYSQAEFAKRIA
jgi:hypothetical protein